MNLYKKKYVFIRNFILSKGIYIYLVLEYHTPLFYYLLLLNQYK